MFLKYPEFDEGGKKARKPQHQEAPLNTLSFKVEVFVQAVDFARNLLGCHNTCWSRHEAASNCAVTTLMLSLMTH